MKIEERIREAVTYRVSRVRPAPEAWESISRRIGDRGRPSPARRVSVAVFALAITAVTTLALWASFRGSTASVVPVGEPTTPSPTASPQPDQTVCFESRTEGDFDADGATDTAILHALVAGTVDCDGAAELPWRFELTVQLGSGAESVQSFDDCQSIDCHLQDSSDFDGDGESELVVTVGPGASVSYSQVYRVGTDRVAAIHLDPPGDPEGTLTPGPILLGGSHDAVWESGFQCQLRAHGSRVLVAWQAMRDDGVSPWGIHFTTLELVGDTFAVVATEDLEDVKELPPEAPCA